MAAGAKKRVPDSALFNGDGTLIVYSDRVTPDGEVLPTTYEIWTVRPDGTDKRQLTSGHKDMAPHFSPDGKQIIFGREGDVWMMSSAGEDIHNVTNTPDVYEHEAQFTSDGNSLLLLAPGPNRLTAEDLAAHPLLALGLDDVPLVVNLKSGTRRQLLDDSYSVKAVFPDMGDDKTVLVLCNALNDDGKPSFMGDKTIVAVPLDGGAPHTFYAPPANSNIEIVHRSGEALLLRLITKTDYSAHIFFTPKMGQTDLKELDKITFLDDLSRDGKTIIGSDIVGDDGKWGLVAYDVASGTWRTIMED